METPKSIYDARVESGTLNRDPNQKQVLLALDQLFHDIDGYKPKPRWLLTGIFGMSAKPPRGLYIYGGVGRGKSMLMDLFFDAIPPRRKRRVHFHAFMQEIHEGMHAARKTGVDDAIRPVAEKVIKDTAILCFDEMQITDITDAMIVGRLFEFLFDAGVIIVTTSNRHPNDLYKDGLNRNLFLPFIELISERLTVLNLDSETDHRQNRLASEQRYFSPLGDDATASMGALWRDLVGTDAEPLVLIQKARKVTLPEFKNGVARASFAELCAKPLGPGDYLAIAKSLRVLFLKDIPILSAAKNNEAKRFVTLIDALYEAQVKLIATAAAAPEGLYETGEGAFEFERTASRLREMQSADWGA